MIDTRSMFKVNSIYRLKKDSPYFNGDNRYGRHFIVTQIGEPEEDFTWAKTTFEQVHVKFLETELIDWYYSDFLIEHYERVE